MSIRQFFWGACFALALLPVQAQTLTAGPISLAQALQAARDNLDVALARYALNGAQADIVSANRAPLPVLNAKLGQMDMQNGLGTGHFLTEKRVDKSIGLDWTWERGNKRALRTRTAEQAASAAQADLEDIRIQQQLTAHANFFDLLAAQERRQHIQQMARLASELAQSAQKRLQAGDMAAQDAARIDIEARRVASEAQLAELERQRAALTLWQTTGLKTAPEALEVETNWPPLPASMTAMSELEPWIEARADVQAARARVQAAQAALDSSLALKNSDITLGASYDHFPGTSTALIELRMQMPLQWGYSYQGEAARASAQLAQAQNTLDKVRRQARAELQGLQQDLLNTGVRARSFETDILPQARQVADNAELAYRKGASSLTDLLDARRTLRATLLEALAARTSHAKAAGAWQLRTSHTGAAASTTSN